MSQGRQFKTGYIAIIGRPNTGKSTLLNALIKQKISIVSRRPQTTRWPVQGIKTTASGQLIFIDTPGYQTKHTAEVNRLMNQEVVNSLSYCDAVVWVCTALKWQAEEQLMLPLLGNRRSPVILLLNKVDQVTDKRTLLPFVEKLRRVYTFAEIMPLSARRRKDVDRLERKLHAYMPMREPVYAADRITNKSVRFIVAECLREQMFLQLGDELPHKTTVTIDSYDEGPQLVVIHATIWIASESHKGMIIGEKGARLRQIGQAARAEMQRLLDKKVVLKSWIKLKPNWRDDINALKQLGYVESG